MHKYLSGLTIAAAVCLVHSSNAQVSTTVPIFPHVEPGWTGYAYKNIVGIYGRGDQTVRAGKGFPTLTKYRGYAVFDISGIPENAAIVSVRLGAITTSRLLKNS